MSPSGTWIAGPFGPTNGAPSVRFLTTPHAVVHPGGSPTVVNPGDNIASKITTAGTNGTLWFTKGTYDITAVLSALQGQTWVLESAAGFDRSSADSAVFDGGDLNIDFLVSLSQLNVTLRGGVFQNHGNASTPTYGSAIFVGGGATKGSCLVEDVVSKDNFTKGLHIQAPGCTARRVYMTNNGRYGISCSESAGGENYTGTVIENCRWSFNNSRLLNPGGDASGSKFTHHPNILVQNNWVHDNYGFGIWPDYAGNDIVGGRIIENVVEHNRRSGIFQEGVDGGLISRNYLVDNGWDPDSIGGQGGTFENRVQIRVTNSDASQGGARGLIERNIIDYTLAQDGSAGGALLLWQHDGHPDELVNWDVMNNQFWLRSANSRRLGGEDTMTSVDIWDNGVAFDFNDYRVVNTTTSFWIWDTTGGAGVAKDWTQWQAFGHDAHSALTVI